MDLASLSSESARRFDLKTAAREQALAEARRSIRSSANAIRAIHREEMEQARELMQRSLASIQTGREALGQDHLDVYFAGFLQDAQKEYAEARLTEVLVTASGALDLPSPDELGVELAPYLNGMAESIGEGRRAMLDLLRRGDEERAERILRSMEEMYYVLVSMDYPDAITGNLRRSTDSARSIIEKTRGDLSVSLMQKGLREALDRHAEELRKHRTNCG